MPLAGGFIFTSEERVVEGRDVLMFGEGMAGENGMAQSVWGAGVKRSLEFVGTEGTMGREEGRAAENGKASSCHSGVRGGGCGL